LPIKNPANPYEVIVARSVTIIPHPSMKIIIKIEQPMPNARDKPTDIAKYLISLSF
jgi:hypothetical protein